MSQFYQLNLERAIADYKEKLISPAGLLKYYLEIKYPNAKEIPLDSQKICSELGLSKDSFYRSIKKLKRLGFIGKTTTTQITFTNKL